MARELTKKGRTLYNLIGGDEFLHANKSRLFEQIDARKLRTAYDVQEYAYEVLFWLKDDPIFDNIKCILYNREQNEDGTTSTHEYGFSDVCFVLSLPLRDMYLEEHPNIR